jgi:hypothetical protein
MVDGFDVMIKEPANLDPAQRARFCAPKKRHPALKYLVFIHMRTGEILHCSDPYPGGSCEAMIVLGELRDELVEGERLLGDCGYAQWPASFLVPKNVPHATRPLNSLRGSCRAFSRTLQDLWYHFDSILQV